MRLIHHELSKPQRAWRAYLNPLDVEKPVLGFKGNPLEFDKPKLRFEHPFTHFHLSRYLFIRSTMERAMFDLFGRKNVGERCYELDVKPLVQSEFEHGFKQMLEFLGDGHEFADFISMDDRSSLRGLLPPTPEKMEVLNRIYAMVVPNFFHSQCPLLALEETHEVYNPDNRNITDIQDRGPKSCTYFALGTYTRLLRRFRDQFNEQELLALSALELLFYFRSSEQTDEYSGGRMKFDRCVNQAWRFIRKHLFDNLTEQIIFDAMKMSGEARIDQPEIDRLFRLHKKHAFRREISANGWIFDVEGSPFTEKPIGNPVGNFELAVYPKDEPVRRFLAYIGDRSFEHADGALALAAFSILPDRLILEEIQTDVLDLVKRSNGHRLDDLDAAYSTMPPGFEAMLDGWRGILLAAVREFAKQNGFTEFYAATPWRVMFRYIGTMHPDKLRNYFEWMEKLGGQLVYDEKSECNSRYAIGHPQYYYRFEV